MNLGQKHWLGDQIEPPQWEAMELYEIDSEPQRRLASDPQSPAPEYPEGPAMPWLPSDDSSWVPPGPINNQEAECPPNLEGFDSLPELSGESVEEFLIRIEQCALHSVNSGAKSFTSGGAASGQSVCSPWQSALGAVLPSGSNASEDTEPDSGEMVDASTPLSTIECDQAASWILSQHARVRTDFATESMRFKKKPMVHEFFGYLLFLADGWTAPALIGCVYFCHQTGERTTPREATEGYFKVARFPEVALIWRRIKSNASTDCIKNLKRAMRMSISNDRQYFVDLPQSFHRQHIYRFGARSLEFFQRVWPAWTGCS